MPCTLCLPVAEFKPNCTLTDVANARTRASRAIKNSESSWHSHRLGNDLGVHGVGGILSSDSL